MLIQTKVKSLLRGHLGTFPSVRLIEVGKVAQCLLMISCKRLLCTVIKLHVVKEAIRVQVHYLSLPTLICL